MGRELQKLQIEAGVSPADVCHEAGVSMSTLYKVYNDEHVRESTRCKVRNALIRLKQLSGAPPAKMAAS